MASEFCLNNLADCAEAAEKSLYELLCLFSYKGGSLRVEAVIFCTAKTILGLKALVFVFHCSSLSWMDQDNSVQIEMNFLIYLGTNVLP